jgi:kinesin family protein 4/21/27
MNQEGGTVDAAVSVKVAVRVRPLSGGEKKEGSRAVLKLDQTKAFIDAGGDRKFDFDYLYGQNSEQSNIYEQTTVPLLNRVMDGFNATILAYGQTGSGKVSKS